MGVVTPFIRQEKRSLVRCVYQGRQVRPCGGEGRKKGKGRKKREILFFDLSEGLVGLGSVPWFKVLHGGKKKFLFFSFFSFFFSFLFLHLVKNFLSFIR